MSDITDEIRIRANVTDYLDAIETYNIASRRAAIAQEQMSRAVENLRALNGLDALRRLGVELKP